MWDQLNVGLFHFFLFNLLSVLYSEFKNIVSNAIKIICLIFPCRINELQLLRLTTTKKSDEIWHYQEQNFFLLIDPLSPDDSYKSHSN